MKMTINSYRKMNDLTAMCFDANAVFDNLAYNLEYHYLNNIADVVHHHIAHLMPVLADDVTDLMLMLSARPTRKPIEGHEAEYDSLKEIFEVLESTLNNIRGAVKDLIESADMESDDEVRIFAEHFLQRLLPLSKQAEEWIRAAENMSDQELNININGYTHFINL